MEKNEIVTAVITDFTKDGEGIGRSDGYTLFVKDAVIGDVVRARITRPKKNYAYARVEEILTASPDRTAPRCAEARRCGGCKLQELSYEKQLLFKQKVVVDALSRIGGFKAAAFSEREAEEGTLSVQQVLGMEDPFRYRNKAQYPIAQTSQGVRAGFYAGRTHSLIPVTDCMLTRGVHADILAAFLSYMEKYKVTPYDEESGRGLVRHLLIREAFATGEILVCPVVNGTSLPHADALTRALAEIPGVCSISMNINQKRNNTILGDRTVALFGKGWITDLLGGLAFRISPRSFYQVNPKQTEVLYKEVLRLLELRGDETVYDLYCGIGTISLFLAGAAREVYGVEIVPDAVRDAKENAERNGIRNVHFYTGAAEDLVASGEFAPGVPCPHADVIVVDPPRKGCDAALIRAMLSLAPERIVYVSCDPSTLARDLKLLAQGDGTTAYIPQYVQPVDMFPQTAHVEVVSLLQKMSNTRERTITLDVEMEDYHRIKNRTEVTADATE